jgi:hypothetical protein
MARRGFAPVRPRVFVGCEGKSEDGYARLLQRLAETAGVDLALSFQVRVIKPGAGDPIQLVDQTVKLIERIDRTQAQRADRFAAQALFLDSDRLSDRSVDRQKIEAIARRNAIRLIWQTPNHEAFLLRHLPGHRNDDPPAHRTEQALKAAWPDYRKGMPALRLAERIGPAEVLRAAVAHDGLADFLADIGLLAALRRHCPPD